MFDSVFIKTLLLYLPVSVIGVWRWTYWLTRRVLAGFYRPPKYDWPKSKTRPTISVVTPVYNEDPVIFEAAMQSWIKNGVDEIIAVIDKSNTRHIVNFERRYVKNPGIKTICRAVVTPKPGKRAALCDGIARASGELIALVDSDTIWDDAVVRRTLPHFLNPRVGGSTVAQRVYHPKNVSDILFDLLLWSRYREEIPFLLGVGEVFNTLSGRTAFYRREAIFNPSVDNLHELRHEFFLGTRGISGDDKRLTHLILEQGWHVAYASDATVYTPGLGKMKKFMKQRLRWTRNSWRADLRATMKGWIWRHPAFGVAMVDRFMQPLFMLIGPVAFAIALAHQEWLFAGILLGWWLVSRAIRLFSYFRRYPARLIYLPAYIFYTYVNAALKIYALATLVEHSWATRWHKQRMRKSMLRKTATISGGITAVVVFLLMVGQLVLYFRAESGYDLPASTSEDVAQFTHTLRATSPSPVTPRLPAAVILPTGILKYVVKPGDTLTELAVQFKMEVKDIKKLNGIPNPNKIAVGQELFYYPPAARQGAQ